MPGYSSIENRVIRPIRSIFYQWYYSLTKARYELNTDKRGFHIVVSLTSYPARFFSLPYSLKSIFNQTLKPDVVFLVLTSEEVKDESLLPDSVLALKKSGLRIHLADINLKPHNKYLSAMKLYPDSFIVTVDDDNIYDKNLIKDLYHSYLKYPFAVSAKRVHKIAVDKNKKLLPYSKWFYEYKKSIIPSYNLLATGVGGVFYPPRILPEETFDIDKIKALCLNADDIWLKFCELKNNIPVVWVKTGRIHPLTIKNTQKVTLQEENFHKGQNDAYINNLENYFGIDLSLLAQ
jgi:hypothetical protein